MPSGLLRCLICLILPVFPAFAAEEPLFNQVHLDAQVERDVENDQLEVTMVVETQGSQPERLAAEVNEAMEWALKLARDARGVEVETRSYQTFPVYRDRTVVGWRSSQELHLKSRDIPRLTELVGDLQERMQVRQMDFSPSRETRVKVENELISEAMVAFRQRADIIRAHMDDKDYRVVNLHVSTGQSGPIPYREVMMSRAVAEDAAAPAVEAGTSKVMVTVSGSIQFF